MQPQLEGPVRDDAKVVGMQRRVDDRTHGMRMLTSRAAAAEETAANAAAPPTDAEMDPAAGRQAPRYASKYAAYGRNLAQKPDLARGRETARPLVVDELDGQEATTVHFDHRRDQSLVDGFFVQLFDRMKLQQSDIAQLEQIAADRRYDFDALMQKARNVDKRLHKAIDDNEDLWTSALANASQGLADENPSEMLGHIDRAAVRIRGWIAAAVCKNSFDNLKAEFDRIERDYDNGGTLAQSRQDDVLIDEVKMELQRGATAAARELDGLPELGRAVYRLQDLLEETGVGPAKGSNIYQLNTRRGMPE